MSVLLPISTLKASFNPLKSAVWGKCKPITRADIKKAIVTKRFCRKPHSSTKDWPRHKHIARIAYLVIRGWSKPIDIDVGVPSLSCCTWWPIVDGNHRLAAAIYRHDVTIAASVSGSLDHAKWLFGVDCEERLDSKT